MTSLKQTKRFFFSISAAAALLGVSVSSAPAQRQRFNDPTQAGGQQTQQGQQTDQQNQQFQGRQRNGGGFGGRQPVQWQTGGQQRGFGQRGGQSGEFQDEFGILVDRNIFMKDRRRMEPPPQITRRPPPTPEQANIITGIVFRENEWFTFIEDTSAYRSQKLRVGDSVANGKISDIETNKVGFINAAGKKIWISVGSNMTGSQQDVVTSRIESALSAGGGGNLTMEEQLRLRRMQALNPGSAAPESGAQDIQPGGEQPVEVQPQQQQEAPQAAPASDGAAGSNLEEIMKARRAQQLNGQ